jgi:hypothetical protein
VTDHDSAHGDEVPAPQTSRPTWLARAQTRLAPLVPRVLRVLPWFSLATGVLGAFFMDRSPDSAWLVLVAALGGWGVLFLFAYLSTLDVDKLSSKQRTLARVGQMTSLVALQSLMQQSLFFALPFYVLAATWLFSHAVFLVVLIAACVVTLWDPVYERLIARAPVRVALQLFSAFAACNAILPALGLSNRASLIVSALFAASGVPLEILVHADPSSRKRRALVIGLLSALLLPLLVSTVLARFIPPSPLRLIDGAIGTVLADRWVSDPTSVFESVPAQLVCATRVSAPRGVRDEIVHLWWKDGRVVDRVAVRIEGGSDTGFRTFSRKQQLTRDPDGVWACVVETVTGQRLGAVRAEIRTPSAPPAP